MNTLELVEKFKMIEHEEGGLFCVTHYKAEGDERPASGSIYYYLQPDVLSQFHVIDCDEYWIYNAGSTVQVWVIDPSGELSIVNLGISEDAVPTLFVKKGAIFGARHVAGETEGTFVTCITVPRYQEGSSLHMLLEDEMVNKYPQVKTFFEK